MEEQVKEIFEKSPYSIDGMNFTEFRNFCKDNGIKGVTINKVLALFTSSQISDGIYDYVNNDGFLIQLSDPTTFEPNKVKKTKQYYFCVM